MSRVINLETPGKERNRLTKSIVAALREMLQQTEVTETTKDSAAYIALALLQVSKTIDKTVEPWEKRGYWVKADRFRMEWDWSENLGQEMLLAVKEENWPDVAAISALVSVKLSNIKLSNKHRLGQPWAGAWSKLNDTNMSR